MIEKVNKLIWSNPFTNSNVCFTGNRGSLHLNGKVVLVRRTSIAKVLLVLTKKLVPWSLGLDEQTSAQVHP